MTLTARSRRSVKLGRGFPVQRGDVRPSPDLEPGLVADQLDFLVAFRRGHRISAALSTEWLCDGAYTHARAALDQALAQEQIFDGVEPSNGAAGHEFPQGQG